MNAEREKQNLAHCGNVPLKVACELGRKELTLKEARRLRVGDVLRLDKLAGEVMEVRLNGHAFARGEIVVIAEQMAVRLTGLEPYPEEVQA
jgi:flagellar motor switch protein FliN/FliY